MTPDVTQWLAEIKALKQQVAQAQQEREQAYASALNWQRLYETEAQQRRLEAALHREAIAQLQQQLSPAPLSLPVASEPSAAIAAAVAHLQTAAELRASLIAALMERDQLQQDLQTEQANHAQTRKSLTTALGDVVDRLKQHSPSE